jgi:hypothetical protein
MAGHDDVIWINDNAIIGQESDVMDLKKALMNQFEFEDCRPMDEYIQLKSLRQEGSSSSRKCHCKATRMNSTFEV